MSDLSSGNTGQGILWRPDFPFSPARWPFFYGWVVVFVSTLGLIASIPGQTIGFSVFADVLIVELGLSRVRLSAAYFLGTALSGFLLPLGGRLLDRWGIRKTMVLSSLAMGLVVVYLSLADRIANVFSALIGKPSHWLISFMVIGIGFFMARFFGQGMLSMTSWAMTGKWFDKRRGRVLATSGIVVSLSFSVAPSVFDRLIQMFGWRGAWWLMAALLIFGMSAIAWIFFRDNPEECGLRMDGVSINPAHSKTKKESGPPTIKEFTLAEAKRSPSFWIVVLIGSYFSMFITGYTFHVVSVGEELGLDRNAILGLFPRMALISILGTLLTGWVCDHAKIKYVLIAVTIALGVCMGGILIMPSSLGIALLVIGLGLCLGSLPTLNGVVWPRFFGRQHLGAISGYALSKIVIGSAFGPLVFSLCKDHFGAYRHLFVLSLGISALMLLSALFADNPQRELTKKVI